MTVSCYKETFKDFDTNVRSSGQNRHMTNILKRLLRALKGQTEIFVQELLRLLLTVDRPPPKFWKRYPPEYQSSKILLIVTLIPYSYSQAS